MDVIIVRNWEEAALALALMQSVVFNFKLRIVKLLGQEGDAMLQEIARATPAISTPWEADAIIGVGWRAWR